MANQTIRSLKEQSKNVIVDRFQITDFKKGDYGYNIVYGIWDNKIRIGTKIDYMKDNDPDATNKIKNAIETNIFIADFIKNKVSPKDSELVEYIDGDYISYIILGYKVNNKYFDFCISLETSSCPNPFKPVSDEDARIVFQRLLKEIPQNIEQFKKIVYTKNFELIKFERLDHFVIKDKTKKNSEHIQLINIIGKAFNVEDSFIIKDFENANIKQLMKKQLKKFKKISLNKKLKEEERTLDLRNVQEIKQVHEEYQTLYKKGDLIFHEYNKINFKQCLNCKFYHKKYDTFSCFSDLTVKEIDNRFSNCDGNCKLVSQLKMQLHKFLEARKLYNDYCKKVFTPTLLEFFNKFNPNLYDYRQNKYLTWKEVLNLYKEDLQDSEAAFLINLIETGWCPPLVFTNNVITLNNKSSLLYYEEFYNDAQNPKIFIDIPLGIILHKEITIDSQKKIVYNHEQQDDDIEIYNQNRLYSTERRINYNGIKLLTIRYNLFKSTNHRYLVNSLLAIFWAYKNDYKKATYYKKIAIKFLKKKLTLKQEIISEIQKFLKVIP